MPRHAGVNVIHPRFDDLYTIKKLAGFESERFGSGTLSKGMISKVLIWARISLLWDIQGWFRYGSSRILTYGKCLKSWKSIAAFNTFVHFFSATDRKLNGWDTAMPELPRHTASQCLIQTSKFREVLFICPICVYGPILLAGGQYAFKVYQKKSCAINAYWGI